MSRSVELKTARWHELENACAGRPCFIIGKGPALQTWLEAGSPAPDDAVILVINHAAMVVPQAHFLVTTDPVHYAVPPGVRPVRGLPWSLHDVAHWDHEPGALWFLHTEQGTPGEYRLHQSRGEIGESRKLYCNMTSTHPAIHFAYYLGCESLLFIGVGVDAGHAACMVERHHRTAEEIRYDDWIYPQMWHISREMAEVLFPGKWSRLSSA